MLAKTAPPAAPRRGNAIQIEAARRASELVRRKFLDVDYYRIRRKLAYPLPLKSLSIPSVPVPTVPGYPWSIWMLWALEERVYSLGWAAEWSGNAEFARAAARDIEGLCAFPTFHQLDRPDLAAGHSGRLLWTAATKWKWVGAPLKEKLAAACARHADEIRPLTEKYYAGAKAGLPRLHNIPLIGTIGAALTASVAGRPPVNEYIGPVMRAILDARETGYTEAVAYDGYILDFIADWLEILPAGERRAVLAHPRLNDLLEQSYMLSAPGAMENVAELSDVEPREMPFHYSAQAKLARFQPDATRAWFLRGWKLEHIRADALGALRPIMDRLQGAAPAPGAHNAHYAVALRTGWESGDVAVAASCTNSATGHLQLDNGTVVIGTRGEWLVADPGYQQYMAGLEREFTIGPAAHNCPVINGCTQDKKEPRLLSLEPHRARLDLAACYPAKANLKSVVRSIWLSGRQGVVIADEIKADHVENVRYHWHGHRDAAWWAQDGWILIELADTALWFTSPEVQLSAEKIQRLEGSRGQLTLVTEAEAAAPVIWWVFGFADTPPELKVLEGGRAIEFLGRRFQA